MRRENLIDARLFAGLTQSQLAQEIGVDEYTVSKWEDGSQTPHPEYIGRLCKRFGVSHPRQLDLHSGFNAPTRRREEELLEMLERFDRRELIALFSKLSILAGIDLAAIFSSALLPPDALLNLARVTINECWNLLESGSFVVADTLLTECVNKLDPIATHASQYQEESAQLACSAIVIQMIIAGHALNLSRITSLGTSLVKYGELSGHTDTHVMAIGWNSEIYKDVLHRPSKAISILNTALPLLPDASPLNQAEIALSLAFSHAHMQDEKQSRDYLEMAQSSMPDNPATDVLYRVIGLGQSQMDTRTGNIYLVLAQYFRGNYAQLAYDSFVSSEGNHAVQNTMGMRSMSLINKANAARLMNDKDEYLACLEKGAQIGLQMDSHLRVTEAIAILQKAPRSWRTDARYTELRKLLTSPTAVH